MGKGFKHKVLTLEDIKNVKYTKYESVEKLKKNYGLGDDIEISIDTGWVSSEFNLGDEKIFVYRFKLKNRECGFVLISENGNVLALVDIYEPHSCYINTEKNLFLCYGHEQIILLWLDEGKFEEIYTR